MVLYDFISSDHKPLLTVFTGLLSNQHEHTYSASVKIDTAKCVADWSKADHISISHYQYELDLACSTVSPPDLTLLELSQHDVRISLIDNYYDMIISCINDALRRAIPTRSVGSAYTEYVVPGWNSYVKDKHKIASDAFLEWNYAGKPRDGPLHYWMKKTRAQFKLALRYCKQHKETISADIAAESLASKTIINFGRQYRNRTMTKQQNLPKLSMDALVKLLLQKSGDSILISCTTQRQIMPQKCAFKIVLVMVCWMLRCQ